MIGYQFIKIKQMKVDNAQSLYSNQVESQIVENDERDQINIQFNHKSEVPEDEQDFNSLKTSKGKCKNLSIWLFRLYLAIAFTIIWFQDFQTYDNKDEVKARQISKKKSHQQEVRKVCSIDEKWNDQIFFISHDFAQTIRSEVENFEDTNRLCNFAIKRYISFNYLVNKWNLQNDQLKKYQNIIKVQSLAEEEIRNLFIWLRLYYNGGIYIHASLGLKFEKFLTKEYLLLDSPKGKIIFPESDSESRQKGIIKPQKQFKTVKVIGKQSENVRKIIQKLIQKEDWRDVCQKDECIFLGTE